MAARTIADDREVATPRDLFESLGISTDSRVVLYGAGPAVSRAFFTLDYLSKAGVSILDGGLATWRTEGKWWKQPGSKGSNVEAVDWGEAANELLTERATSVLRAAGR